MSDKSISYKIKKPQSHSGTEVKNLDLRITEPISEFYNC